MEMTDFFLIYQRACVLCAVVQLFGERAGHGASGERVSDAAAAQHHQTQGGAVPRVGSLAGGHALGDQPTGAAEGGGEEEGEAGGEGEDGRTSEEQVSEGEGRGREGILLLFQRQVTKTSSGSLNRPEPMLV